MAETGPTSSKWADLGPRIASAVVLAAVGLSALWLGGVALALLATLVVGLIGWEITRMCAPGRPALWAPLGALTGAALLAGLYLPGVWAVVPIAGAVMLATVAANDRPRQALYLAWVLTAGWGLVELRALGLVPVLWLVALVIATDIAGYFAGRMIGGPKFWPKVSPKKTWSGTAAGWIAAALVGIGFMPWLGPGAIWLSVIISFASQMGDAAESALKRAKGVKDASALIPGHGGVFDRFDAMLGAALMVTLARLTGLIGG